MPDFGTHRNTGVVALSNSWAQEIQSFPWLEQSPTYNNYPYYFPPCTQYPFLNVPSTCFLSLRNWQNTVWQEYICLRSWRHTMACAASPMRRMLSWWKRESIIAEPDEIGGCFTKSSAKFGFSSSSNSSTSGACCLFMTQNTKSWFKMTASGYIFLKHQSWELQT